MLKLLQVVCGLGLQTFVCDFSRQNICSVIYLKLRRESVQNILIWCVTENMSLILLLSCLRYREMTTKLITFNHLSCHSSSTTLGTRTGQHGELQMKQPCRGFKGQPRQVEVEVLTINRFHSNFQFFHMKIGQCIITL